MLKRYVRVGGSATRASGKRSFSSSNVAIIGAGFSGLITALQLKRKGIENFTIYESADRVGGTWYKNTYPGVACDTPAPSYAISDVASNWSSERPSGAEIRQYLEDTAETYDLMEHIQFNTSVEEARWNEETKRWQVATLDRTKKAAVTRSYNSLISAVGQLNIPKFPDFPGLRDFSGPMFHTALWDHSANLRSKRVGIIGAGPSAIQVATPVAEQAKSLTLFQRTVPYVLGYDYKHWSEADREQHMKDPSKLEEIRKSQFDEMEDMFTAMYQGEDNALKMKEVKQQMREALPERLHSVAIPDYPLGTKRMGISPSTKNGRSTLYFDTLAQEHVDVERERIERVEINGIRTRDGKLHELDVLIIATGFDSTKFVSPINVVGQTGETLEEAWGGTPRGFYGMMMPDFPNFYMIYGPGTNLGQNTVLVNIESSAKYVSQCIGLIGRKKCSKVEVSKAAMERYYSEYREKISDTVWAVDGVDSWYKTSNGTVVNQSPFSVVEYAARTENVRLEDLVLSP
mmetsp:Transcript_19071/g.26654  ORF Transcript_19071/g.26654 Transcript_19071/m.26654 type:complete len:516 (+) Transcript_19071:154-1701(+)